MGDSCCKISQYGRVVMLNLVNAGLILVSGYTLAFMLLEIHVLEEYGRKHGYGIFFSDVVIITACLLVIAMSFYGMIAAMKEHVKSLHIYFFFLVILLGLVVLIIINASLQRFELQYKVSDWMRKDFFLNTTGPALCDQQRLWDELQSTYTCCGLYGPGDYLADGKPISQSCCSMLYYGQTANERRPLYSPCPEYGTLVVQGCEGVIISLLTFDGKWLISVVIIHFGFAILAMLLAKRLIENATPYDIDDSKELLTTSYNY